MSMVVCAYRQGAKVFACKMGGQVLVAGRQFPSAFVACFHT